MSKAFVNEDSAGDGDEPELPPPTSGARYITPEGYRRLAEELDHLWKVERPRVTREVEAAAALGDRSENAEYIYGKKRLREIDRRLRWLGKRLDHVTVVSEPPDNPHKVFFGAFVTLADEEGAEVVYRVVGSDDLDTAKGWISLDSPVGRALLGKEVGDVVTVRRPRGEAEYEILAVRYG